MKRISSLSASILAMAIMLGGCSSTGELVKPTPDSLRQAIVNTCGYYAEVGPLATLISNFVPIPGVSTTAAIINQLSTQVCSAFIVARSAPTARPGGALTVIVNGVAVTGRF